MASVVTEAKCSADHYAAQTASNALHESNDCVPMALALSCDKHYGVAHALCQAMGRKNGKGMFFGGQRLIAAALALGCSAVNVYRRCGSGFTVSTVGRRYPAGSYLIRTRRHVLAMTDGVVMDWTKGRKHRVIEIWQMHQREAIR
jgi:hypothetical protein